MRHNRLTTSLHKDSKLQRLFRDILADIRSCRLFSSPTVRVNRTAHGTTLEVVEKPIASSTSLKSYIVISEQVSTLTCRTWNGTTAGDTDVTVYKPDELCNTAYRYCLFNMWQIRVNPLQLTVAGVLTTSANKRFSRWENTDDALLNQAYKEVIYPPYVQSPNGTLLKQIDDGLPILQFVISAMKDDTGRLVDQNSGRWHREWKKEVVVCTKNGTKLALLPSSHVYDAPISFSTV